MTGKEMDHVMIREITSEVMNCGGKYSTRLANGYGFTVTQIPNEFDSDGGELFDLEFLCDETAPAQAPISGIFERINAGAVWNT